MDEDTIRYLVEHFAAVIGLACFAVGDIYQKSFQKLGKGGLVIYLSIGLIVWMLIRRIQKIEVEERFQALVLTLTFGLTCLGSIILDMLETAKSDVFSIISYGLFALMSLSMSRESKLGFETGFSSFFLSLFASQVAKISRPLSPIAIVLCSVIFYLSRSTKRGGGQHDSTNQNDDAHLRGVEQQSSSDRIPETGLRQEQFRRGRFSRTLSSTSSSKYSVETSERSIGQVKMAEPKQSSGDHKRHTNVEQSSGDHKERTNVEESSGDRIFSEKEEQTKEPSSHDSSSKEARIDLLFVNDSGPIGVYNSGMQSAFSENQVFVDFDWPYEFHEKGLRQRRNIRQSSETPSSTSSGQQLGKTHDVVPKRETHEPSSGQEKIADSKSSHTSTG